MTETKIHTTGIALDIDETLSATNRFWITMLAERFGNPENLSHDEIIARYRYTQHVPFWQTPEALAWMEGARNSDEIQEALPLIENANHVVNQLQKVVPIAAYITARPERVRGGTLTWLSRHGFPDAPLLMRPEGLDYKDGNSGKWKAELLALLYPMVWGIIDDNVDVVSHLPSDYRGVVFLYDHDREDVTRTDIKVVAVKKWEKMFSAVSAFAHENRRHSPQTQSRNGH